MKEIRKTGELAPGPERLHLGVFADSGEGKTYWKNEVHKACDQPSILIAQPKPADDYKLHGKEIGINTPKKAIKKALKSGKKLHLNPASNGEAFLKQVVWLYQVIREMNRPNLQARVIIFIDEVHRIAGEKLGDLMTDGRGNGIHFVYSTQYMSRLKKDACKDMIYAIDEEIHLGINEEMKGFYRYYNIPWKKIKERTRKDYTFVRRKDGELSQPMRV